MDWLLWCTSWPCTSCISLGETPVHCVWVFSTRHFILAWWIFKLHIFLHIFLQRYIEFDDYLFKVVFVTIRLFLLRLSCSPSPLGIPWGSVTVVDSVALILITVVSMFRLCLDESVPIRKWIMKPVWILFKGNI